MLNKEGYPMRKRKRTPPSQVLFRFAVVLAILLIAWGIWLIFSNPARTAEPSAPKVQAPVPSQSSQPPQSEPTETPAPPQTDPTQDSTPQTEPVETGETAAPTETEAETDSPEPGTSTVTLMAVGDNLIHETVYLSGQSTDPWNYDHFYAHIKDDIAAADIAIINQETIFVKNHQYVSGYPNFGTPREVGDAVYKAGFDVILHATNHVMDMGIQNVYDAIDYWSDKDVTVLGIHKSAADAKTPKIVEKNGIRIGMINYTYGTNGKPLPAGNEFAVDLLDNRRKLLSDIAYLEEHADITIAFLHMGTEYEIQPSPYSRDMVELAVANGVDVCINVHPHVVEPYEEYTAANGNKAVVYYSLGNFISSQTELDRLIGGMAKLTIQKHGTGDEAVTEVTSFELLPLVTHVAEGTEMTVYHLEDYTDALGAQNIRLPLTVSKLWDRWHEIVGDE